MGWIRRLTRAVRPGRDDREVDAELRLHLDMETEDLMAQGLPPEDARRRASLALGGLERFRTEAREARRGRWLYVLPGELQWAWRGVRRRWTRSVFHAGLIALTIAASAVVFSATDAYVFHPAPYPNADRLVVFRQQGPHSKEPTEWLAVQEILVWRQRHDLFASVEAHTRAPSMYVTIGTDTESVEAWQVTPGLFQTLGVLPRWGRPFRPDDAQPGRPPVVLVSDQLARRVFGSPARAVGQDLPSGSPAPRIVGVMPAGFRFPTALEQVWQPLRIDQTVQGGRIFTYPVVALLAPGVSLDTVDRTVKKAERTTLAHVPRLGSVTVTALPTARRDPRSVLFVLLLGAALCLLLVACLNVASLELAGALGRTRLYAIQTTLGATRASLVRTALIEGGLLTGAGALGAIGLAILGVHGLTGLLPAAMTNAAANPIDVDSRVIVLMAGAAVLTWIVTSLPVVWRASRPDLADGLRHGASAATPSRTQTATRYVLMSAQVALTVVLLAGASLFVRSYAAHLAQDKGFDSARLATIQVLAPFSTPARRKADLEEAILARLQTFPSVLSVSRTESLLPSTRATLGSQLEIQGRQAPAGWVNLRDYLVDPEYFGTVGIRLQAGRSFGPADPPGAIVVDETFARRFWPRGDALGAQFTTHAGWGDARAPNGSVYHFTIVGIAAHVRGDSPENPTGDGVFVIYGQLPHLVSRAACSGCPRTNEPYAPLSFIARLDDDSHLGAVTDMVRPMAAGDAVRTELVDGRYARLYGDTRIAADITSGFGILAFIVAIAGIYGVVAFLVAGRTREIGIRLALGADRRDVRRLVFGPTLVFVGTGALAGIMAALFSSRWLQSQLFGVSATDPMTYVVTALAILVTALAATWRPAQTAANADPTITLRAE